MLKRLVPLIVALAVPTAVGAAPPAEAGEAVAAVTLSASALTLEPGVPHDAARLTVAGDGRIVLRRELAGAGAVSWDLRNAAGELVPDGVYTWELVLVADGVETHEGREIATRVPVGRTSGRLEVRGGRPVAPEVPARRSGEPAPAAAPTPAPARPAPQGGFTHPSDVTIDGGLLIGLAEAPVEDLQIVAASVDGEDPAGILFQNLDSGGEVDPGSQWALQADMENDRFQLINVTPGGEVERPLTFEEGADDDSIYVDDFGNVGLGTATPGERLHLAGATAQIELEDVGGGTSVVLEYAEAGPPLFSIEGNSLQNIVQLDATAPAFSLTIDADGNLGSGTDEPQHPLHVTRADGNAKVLVEETSGETKLREMFKLSNNGGPFFVFTDRSRGESFAFSMLANGDFQINQQQNPGVEYRFTPTGNLTIAGSLTQNSSREAKRDLAPVDGREVLARVLDLPVREWSYRHDPPRVRHIGPMAEEFHAAFGVGRNPRGISSLDTGGVAFAAIQGLHAELEERDAEVERLRAEVAELRALVEGLVGE